MFSHTWIRQLFDRQTRTIREDQVRFRPRLEGLEDRTLPSTVATTADLIAAIRSANAVGGATTITLAANTAFKYTSASDTSNGANALPAITANITIVGNGDTIERTGTTPFRLFDVAQGGSLTLEDLTLMRGLAQGADAAAEGGAIYSAGTLSLSGVTLASNTAQGGDGVRPTAFGAENGTAGASGRGGALYVAGGVATLSNDTLSSNNANGGAGGTGLTCPAQSGVAASRFGGAGGGGGNGSGGGLYVAGGLVTLSNDTFSSNNANGGAGGTGGKASQGGRPGGGGSGGAGLGGAVDVAGGTVALNGDTFDRNNAAGGQGGQPGALEFGLGSAAGGPGGAGQGGGLYVNAAAVTMVNDTLTSNIATGGQGLEGGNGSFAFYYGGGAGGPGGAGQGGGLCVDAAAVTMVNNTVAKNHAFGGQGAQGGSGGTQVAGVNGSGGDGKGGGLYIGAGSTANLANTLIAQNTVAAGAGGSGARGQSNGSPGSASGPDVSGTLSSSDHDLISDGTDSNLIDGINGDKVGTSSSPIDPQFGPLLGNGGPTQTMALLLGSPAIDTGDNNAAPAGSDQRGYGRIVGNAIDIGAYEYDATASAADLSVSADLSVKGGNSNLLVPDEQLTYQLTVANNGSTAQSNVTLTDVLPANIRLASWSVPSGWSSSAPDHGSPSGTVSAWISSLPANTSAVFNLVVQLGPDPNTLLVSNIASVGPLTGDPDPSNNSVTLNSLVYYPSPDNASQLIFDVEIANVDASPIVITLQHDLTIDFTSAYGSTPNALPVLTGNLTIVGNGDTIARSTAAGTAAFRLFEVALGGSLTLEDLTLTGGLARGTGMAAEGGAIYSAGTLSLSDVTIASNTAQGDNGTDSYFSGPGASAAGGGLFVADGTATLINSTLSNNNANGGAGGNGVLISLDGFSGISIGGSGGDGDAASGGGLYVAGGQVTLSNDTLSSDNANGGAGGNGSGTERKGLGGVGGAGSGGGVYVAVGAVTLNNTTLYDDFARGGAGGNGGRRGNAKQTVGGAGSGGGVAATGGAVTLINDTLSGNSAEGGNGGNTTFLSSGPSGGNGLGGGLYIASGSNTNLANTLIAENTVTAGAQGSGMGKANLATSERGSASGPDVYGTVAASDHDLIGDGSDSNLSNSTNGDQVGTSSSPIDPLLAPTQIFPPSVEGGDPVIVGPLQDNGGPTKTIALEFGSPAIGTGDSNVAPAAIDQRGYARIVGAGIDIGAYQFAATAAATNLSVSGNAASSVAAGIQSITYTLTVTNNSSAAQSNVTLVDLLPVNTTLASWTVPNGWSSSAPAAGSDSRTVSAWIASLAANTSATFTLVVQVNGITAQGTVINNTAAVGPLTGDPAPNDNSISFQTTALVAPTLSVTDVGGTYNGTAFPVSGTAVGVNGQTVAGSFSYTYYAGNSASGTALNSAPVAAGTYTVVGTFSGTDPGYTSGGTAQDTFTIAPLAVTLGGFRLYDGTTTVAPDTSQNVFSHIFERLTITNLIGGDLVTLSGSGTLAGADVGSEAITSFAGFRLGGIGARNYTLVGASGSVTINPRTVGLGGTRPYDGTATAAADILSITNQVSGDNLTLSGNVTLNSGNAGSQIITSVAGLTLGGSSNGNYTLIGAGGTVYITQQSITVTANPLSKPAGTGDPSLTYQVTAGSLVGSDSFSGSLTRDPGETVGAYTIRQGSLTAGSNYALTFVSSVLLITATNDPLQSGQTVGVTSTAGASTAATTPAFVGAPQLKATASGFDGSLTVAQYQGAPVSGFTAAGSYYGINADSSDIGAGSSLGVVLTNLTPGAAVFWLNGSTWQPVTDASGNTVTANASGTATVTLTTATSPSLAQLSGIDFFVGTFQPTLTAAAGDTVVVGTSAPLTAMANLADGVNESGNITFTLYDPSGNKADVETVSVNGDGIYATPKGFVPTVAGAYEWVAAYTSANSFNSNVSTTQGATPEVAVGSGATVVGNALYLVGGNRTNDQIVIKAAGTSQTGSTGILVKGKVNGVNLGSVTYSQSFDTLYMVGFDGNNHVQEDALLAIATVVREGNGNDQVTLGNGNNTVTLGGGNDQVQAGNGNNNISLGNGNDNVQLGDGNNVVVAGNGNNTIQAGNGNNLVVGELGHDTIQVGNGRNILIDGSVSASMGSLDLALSDWVQYGNTASNVSTIRALLGKVTFNSTNANKLLAGSGLDWFWSVYPLDQLNNKLTDLRN